MGSHFDLPWISLVRAEAEAATSCSRLNNVTLKSQNINWDSLFMQSGSKMGRPKVDSEAITLRLPRDMIEAIDDLRRHEADLPTRPEMIRRALQEWLGSKETSG